MRAMIFIKLFSSVSLILLFLSCQTNINNIDKNRIQTDTVHNETDLQKEVANLHNDYVSAWMRGDGNAAMGYWSDDIIMYAPGSNPHSGIYHGKSEVQQNLIDRIYKETSNAEVLGQLDQATGIDHVFTIVHERFTKPDGRVFETKRVVIYRWANQKIIEIRYFDTDQKAADIFWSK